MEWRQMLVSVDAVLQKIRPGMSVFLSSGAAEPRMLVKDLMAAHSANLQDLVLIQIISFDDAISLKSLQSQKFRLKTFFSGWVANEAITAGNVDLIPSCLSQIPDLLEKQKIPVDIVFVQITPPDKYGYCSLGGAVDVARRAMEQADLVVGEINTKVPRTMGDTFVKLKDFDMLVQSDELPVYFDRWPVEPVYELIAANIEPLIEDRSCIAFSIGPLFEALSKKLIHKKHLGIHSPFFSDALMDLVESGTVSNRHKELFKRKSITSYACGTSRLFQWLDQNSGVEFQPVDKVFDPLSIGQNPQFVAVISAKGADLTGKIALHTGLGNLASGPAEVLAFLTGAQISEGGYTIFGLPSRSHGKANVTISIEGSKNHLEFREAVDYVVTEFGSVNLKGLTLRERAQALIEIAHPDDRAELISAAKREHILYQDQIYLAESAQDFPSHLNFRQRFKSGVEILFRPIRPSDEEEMRRLFYRFSDESVYYRYFSSLKAMPHTRMQTYVNVDWGDVMSIVGVTTGKPREGVIVAEARYLVDPNREYAEIAFIVDESHQRVGIASYLFNLLFDLAKKSGLKGFWADVLVSNSSMMKVFYKSGLKVQAEMEDRVYHVTIPFE